MKTSLKKMVMALGSLAMVGTAASAFAFPSFSINPGSIPMSSNTTIYNGLDQIKGGASETIAATSATTVAGAGIFTLDGFYAGSTDKFSPSLSSNFNMYVVFDLTATLKPGSGALGAPGSLYFLNTLNFTLFADPGGNDTFTPASASGPGTSFGANPGNTISPATVTGSGDDILIGYGSIIGTGAAAINGDSTGGSTGAALNSTETLALCTGVGTAIAGATTSTDARAAGCTSGAGKGFFFAPSPFYSIAFDEFNNTAVEYGPGFTAALSGGSGSINFAIPEPDSIALLGIAAVAAGLATRRRRKA